MKFGSSLTEMGARGTKEGEGMAFLQAIDPAAEGCIEYPFGRWSTGYGRVRHQGRPRPAHVVSYEIHVGPVPDGMEVCHNCGNRPCVKPAHLRADTHQANMADCDHHGTDTRGERNGRARLSAVQVGYVRAEVAGGRRQLDVASELGVSLQAVNHIIKGRTWKAAA